MNGTAAAVDAGITPLDAARAARCRIAPARFAVLLLELVALLAVFRLYRLHELIGDGFFTVAAIGVGAFALHYWLPLRLKEPCFIAVSIGALPALFGPAVAALALAAALLVFAIGCTTSNRARLALLLAFTAACVAGRLGALRPLPEELWPLLGSLFLFRLPIWAYDRAHARGRPSLKDHLAYFLQLPNWGCLLYPVVDFHTQRKSFLARDQNDIAQQGVAWMARGLLQLVIYTWLYNARDWFPDPFLIDDPLALAACMVRVYLLYLRLSGTFHFVIGLLHLFGYDLPETHRRWLLSSSLTDFWRRINVYWKDFMVKLVWFPIYFRWRRAGEKRAQLVATALVFVATWFLHAAQTFFATGAFLWRATDLAFWGILGALVMGNLALELRPGAAARAAALAPPARALRIAVTAALLIVLWSMWNAPTFADWFDLLTWWKAGS